MGIPEVGRFHASLAKVVWVHQALATVPRLTTGDTITTSGSFAGDRKADMM
jgi:hypothetical protein